MKKSVVLFLAFILAFPVYSKDEKEEFLRVRVTAHLNLSDLVELAPGWSIPASGTYTGIVSHHGTLDQMNSGYELTGWVIGSTTVTQFNEGVMTGANGESLLFTAVAVFQIADHTGVVTVTITGGTGRYTDATGSLIMSGYLDPPGLYHWQGEGTIRY